MVRQRKNGRPKNEEESASFEVTGVEPKLLVYLEELRRMQGFGNSQSAIARNFVWKEVNRLLETGRLKPK